MVLACFFKREVSVIKGDKSFSLFEKIYQDYVSQIRKIDLKDFAKKAGVKWDGNNLIIPLFSKPFYVSKDGIKNSFFKRPSHMEVVVLSRYIISYPEKEVKEGEWCHYRDFKDSKPLLDSFYNNVEKKIADAFKGRKALLEKSCKRLNGIPYNEGWSWELSFLFHALPNIPVVLLFNDEEEGFPSECKLLFRRSVERYLDMESVAILGMILTEYLLSLQESL